VTKIVIGAISFAILAQFKSEEESSFDVMYVSFVDWMEGNKLSPDAVLVVTTILVSALLVVQMYVGIIFLRLSGLQARSISNNQAEETEDIGVAEEGVLRESSENHVDEKVSK